MGGLFVGLVAPNVFHAYYEFPIGLMICAAVLFLLFAREFWRLPGRVRYASIAAPLAALCWYVWFLAGIMNFMVDGYRVVARNFYGQLRVYDKGDPSEDPDAVRELVHGIETTESRPFVQNTDARPSLISVPIRASAGPCDRWRACRGASVS